MEKITKHESLMFTPVLFMHAIVSCILPVVITTAWKCLLKEVNAMDTESL
jgi:hypothetical protein